MTWKKVVASVLAATLAFALAGCGSDKKEDKAAGDGDKVHLTVFAAASMTETMNQIAAQIKSRHLITDFFFRFGRRFFNNLPYLLKDFLNFCRELPNIGINGVNIFFFNHCYFCIK